MKCLIPVGLLVLITSFGMSSDIVSSSATSIKSSPTATQSTATTHTTPSTTPNHTTAAASIKSSPTATQSTATTHTTPSTTPSHTTTAASIKSSPTATQSTATTHTTPSTTPSHNTAAASIKSSPTATQSTATTHTTPSTTPSHTIAAASIKSSPTTTQSTETTHTTPSTTPSHTTAAASIKSSPTATQSTATTHTTPSTTPSHTIAAASIKSSPTTTQSTETTHTTPSTTPSHTTAAASIKSSPTTTQSTAATHTTPSTTTIHGAGPHYHPIYRYSCNEDLTVTFKGVNGIVKYYMANDTQPQPGNCSITPVDGHHGNFKLTEECLTSPDNETATRFVYVSVFDKNEGESQTTNAKQTPDIINGGRHVFKLTCLPIPEGGVQRNALAETGVHDLDVMGKVYNEVDDVDMRFKETDAMHSPDISEVYIGDMFFMYIKYMGASKYTLLPMTCSANQGTYRLSANTPLWDIKTTNCLSDEATRYKIMESFIRDNDQMVHAKLHGFRFATDITGGVGDVTISCVVKMCRTDSNNCGIASNSCSIPHAPPPPTNRRRRRQTETNQRLKTISRTFKVKKGTNSGGRVQLAGGLVYIVAVAVFLQRLF